MTITLPTEKSQPNPNIGDYPFLIYGFPKVGKSTFASKFEDAIFLSTEPGLEALSVYSVKITSWKDFLRACRALTEEHSFKTVIVDTVGPLYAMCRHHVGNLHGFSHESDLDWGKGWQLVREEFARAVIKLSMMGMGLVIIAHADAKDIKTSKGEKTRIVPDLPKGARDTILPLVSLILYFEVAHTDEDGDQHVIRTRATDRFEAGVRLPERRQMPDPLPMDYDVFEAAFVKLMTEGMGKER